MVTSADLVSEAFGSRVPGMRQRNESRRRCGVRYGLLPLSALALALALALMIACDRPGTAATRSPETASTQEDENPSGGAAEPGLSVASDTSVDGDPRGEGPTEGSAGEEAAAAEPCGEEAIPEEVEAILGTVEGLEFDVNKWTIRPSSFPVLDGIVEVLQRHPAIVLEIQGHRDEDPHWQERAVDITRKRAEAVRVYLLEHGVESSRLVSQGYGPDRPLAPNTSPKNRALNRRIELHVIEEKSSLPPCPVEPGA